MPNARTKSSADYGAVMPGGRPKSDNPKTQLVRARVEVDIERAIKAAAERQGQNVSEWVRDAVIAALEADD